MIRSRRNKACKFYLLLVFWDQWTNIFVLKLLYLAIVEETDAEEEDGTVLCIIKESEKIKKIMQTNPTT